MVLIGRGPRAVEAQLLAELDRALEPARTDPAALARPVRIVVPSRSLAQHLAERVVRRAGRPLLGVSIRTVHALACDVVQRAGHALPADEGLLDAMVRRALREEPALAALAELVDGHATVSASVRDLLDAGLDSAHAEALEDAIAAEAPPGELAQRAHAVVRVACRIAREIERGAFGHRSRLFRVARELLESEPQAALPARGILIHGFADATGVVSDLLETLVRRAGATLFLDRPPDPAEPARDDPGVRFGDRFAARMLAGAPPPAAAATAPATTLRVLHATGAWAEVRAVADEVRAVLDAGDVPPERLGVVARDLSGHGLALRSLLRRLGIPFSGHGEVGPPGPSGRRLAGLGALLRDGPRTRTESWLELLELDLAGGPLTLAARADLRIGLRALGASRVGRVAQLRTAAEGEATEVALPVRARIAADGEGGAVAHRRVLPRALLDAAIARARDLVEGLREQDAPPARRPIRARAEALRELAREALGWRDAHPGMPELAAALSDGALGPSLFEVDAEELRLLLERRLAQDSAERLGGAGGGVQVLSVTEARARCFDRLWVLGLARDVFPRIVTEDPLLPDPLRNGLRAVLPDLPRKRDGHAEERFLFAQLAAASPEVALVGSTCDDDGRPREVSPFVERLQHTQEVGEPEAVPSPTGPGALAAKGLRPAHERALLAALHGGAADFAALLPVAVAEVARELDATRIDAAALAAARLAVLRELDRAAHRGAPLGPYFGFVGRLRPGADPRRGQIAVTTLESLFRCPWQTWLAKLLRIEAPPDAVGGLPGADGRAVGSLVHRAIDRVARESLGEPVRSIEEAVAGPGTAIAWPAPAELDEIVLDVARDLLREEGVAFAGLERVLALAAREPLALARELDEREQRGGDRLVGSEVDATLGVVDAAGAARELRLRIDRVDRRGAALLLTDYKTGKLVVDQTTGSGRSAALLRALGRGKLLQAPAYAAVVRAQGRSGLGRYVYLGPDADERTRELGIDAADAELAAVFDATLARAFAAWDEGSFFPRLVESDSEKENRDCESCELKEACLRGDSSARGRLAGWTAQPPPAPTAAEAALLGLWRPGDPA